MASFVAGDGHDRTVLETTSGTKIRNHGSQRCPFALQSQWYVDEVFSHIFAFDPRFGEDDLNVRDSRVNSSFKFRVGATFSGQKVDFPSESPF